MRTTVRKHKLDSFYLTFKFPKHLEMKETLLKLIAMGDIHGWHAHSDNFTGVYYLDLPTNAPKTQIINSFTQDNILTPEVEEGDLLMFPSYVIHRAPKITENINKTIISFNCTVLYVENP